MQAEFHTIKIVTSHLGNKTRIEMDGRELWGVTAVSVNLEAGQRPTVTIELVPEVLTVEGTVREIAMSRKVLLLEPEEYVRE